MKEDGGPAFPSRFTYQVPNGTVPTDQEESGMSLRDWLAGKSAAGLRSASGFTAKSVDVAKLAYEDADAMLKEREK